MTCEHCGTRALQDHRTFCPEYTAQLEAHIERMEAENARLRAELERKTSAYDELAETATRSNARLREALNRMELERDSAEMQALKAKNSGQDGWGETDE